MKAVKEPAWEKTLARYFAANGLPLQWNGLAKRYRGIAGHMFARLNPDKEEQMWVRLPKYLRDIESPGSNPDGKSAVLFITNKKYGDSVDDSIVVMRLGTFIPMIKSMYYSDRERYEER
jgi:hypothetical protein